jgi:hypothetical protein
MDKKGAGISQISKYLDGKLDAKAMHRLEKLALDDPFLMEALEGYENSGNDRQRDVNELISRLRNRTLNAGRRVVYLRTSAIAASILIIISIGGFWLYRNQPAGPPKIAEAVKPGIEKLPGLPKKAFMGTTEEVINSKQVTVLSRHRKIVRKNSTAPILAAVPATAPVANAEISNNTYNKDTSVKDDGALSEMIVMNYSPQKKKKDTAGTLAVAKTRDVKKAPDTGSVKLLESRVAGVSNTVSSPSEGYYSMSIMQTPIAGKVIGLNDGLPLIGATVKVAGTNIATLTDKQGFFTLHADSTKSKLIVASIGYQTRELNINNRDSLNGIKLEPSSAALNEVVVVGYTAKQKVKDTAIGTARPTAGWHEFRLYLNKNAVSPDGKTGMVKVSFGVNYKGSISDIHIVSGLSAPTNQKAIDLITNGPAWTGNTTGKPETVIIKIKFKK